MSLPILKRTAAACRMDLVRTTASTSAAVSLKILDAVCFNKCSTCVVSVDEITAAQFNAYPNPFNATLTLDIVAQVNNTQLFIADLSGRVVLEQNIVAGSERVVLNTESLKAGSCIVQWLNQGAAQARVFVKH